METALEKLKQGAPAAWAAGDYDDLARRLVWDVGARAIAAARITAGDRVLDVACGTGNAAIRAARAGADVVGLDLTPPLLQRARRAAEDANVEVEWIEGDAEALPFPDESFDVVVSLFGCMFAPRHDVTAWELARVLARNGRLVVCSWTPQGSVGTFNRIVGSFLPPQPEIAAPPVLWGDEQHVRELFADTQVQLSMTRELIRFPAFDGPEDEVDYYSRTPGPLVLTRRLTEADGRWPALREALLNHAGAFVGGEVAEFLLVTGRKG
jgi:ubiquinone/menaquinone biosynthesis C-methylase UbiE